MVRGASHDTTRKPKSMMGAASHRAAQLPPKSTMRKFVCMLKRSGVPVRWEKKT